MSAPSPNELMQEGIQQVRDNRSDEAYNTFKQVVARDPNSEFGWIWVSVTSHDRAEKRAALERALQINPNSQHAREALRSLDAEAPKASPPPPFPAVSPRIGEAEINTAPQVELRRDDSLRAALTEKPRAGRVRKEKAPKAVVVKDQRMVSQKRPQRASPLFFLLSLIFAIVIIAVFVWFFLFRNPNQNQDQQAGPAPAETTAAVTTEAVPTTAAVDTASPTTAATSPSEAATTASVTTAAATTTASVTTASTTTVSATTASVTTVAGTPGVATLPAGASQTAQIAKALENARQSQVTGDYAAAVSSYQAALQADPRNVPANLGLGNLYLNAPDSVLPSGVKRYDEAVKAFQTVTQQAPNWPGGYALLGEALADQGQVKPAITAYVKSLELDPNGPERWTALATLYEKDNQPDQARYARERAGLVKPATPTPVPTTAPPPTQPPAPPAPPKTQPPAPTPTKAPRAVTPTPKR